MKRHKIYKKLDWLNGLPADEAEYVFRECGGSPQWARLLSASRPFPMLEQLFARAGDLLATISDSDNDADWQVIRRRLGDLLER